MIFYRHPTPDAAPGLCYGRLDIGLSPKGMAEVEAALKTPPRATRIISSPARRALALATPLARAAEATLEVDERLWEMDFGAWEGKFWNQIDRAESDPWAEDPLTIAPPGGENFGDVVTRVEAALVDADDNACIVAHAGPIRAAKMLITGASFDEVFAAPVAYARPIILIREDA